MRVEHRVHGVSSGRANVPTEVDGEQLTASVECLEVELVSKGDRHGNQTLRFTGSAMQEAKELFTPDRVIYTTYEAGDALPAVEAGGDEEQPAKKKK